VSERDLNNKLREALRGHGHFVRVENAVESGTPDINFCNNYGVDHWIECKHVAKWPTRNATALRVHHFTAEQRLWLAQRIKAGGNAWVLLQVGKDYLLFDGGWAAAYLGHESRAGVEAGAVSLDWAEIVGILVNANADTPVSV